MIEKAVTGLDCIPGYRAFPKPPVPSVVTIGNFDGVHLGHQVLLSRVTQHVEAQKLRSVVYTFEPHPLKVLAPAHAPRLISTPTQKLSLLRSCGISTVVVEPFDRAFASLSAAQFVQDVLHASLGAKVIVAGYDFKFGQGGRADTAVLRSLAEPLGIALDVVDSQAFAGEVASSTKVRARISEGAMEESAQLLGRPYSITGTVRHGDARGRKLGFPTANIIPEQELLPPHGVYLAVAHIDGRQVQAVINLGTRPTFQGEILQAEAHLLDFQQDLYGKFLSLDFRTRLRGEKSFSSIEELISQIEEDVRCARSFFKE